MTVTGLVAELLAAAVVKGAVVPILAAPTPAVRGRAVVEAATTIVVAASPTAQVCLTALVVAAGSGNTELISGVACSLLTASPSAVRGPAVLSAATTIVVAALHTAEVQPFCIGCCCGLGGSSSCGTPYCNNTNIKIS